MLAANRMPVKMVFLLFKEMRKGKVGGMFEGSEREGKVEV